MKSKYKVRVEFIEGSSYTETFKDKKRAIEYSKFVRLYGVTINSKNMFGESETFYPASSIFKITVK